MTRSWFRRFWNNLFSPRRGRRGLPLSTRTRGCRLRVEQLEDRVVPASTITILATGAGSLDAIFEAQSGLITVTNGANNGTQAETLSAGALASIPANDSISITARTSISFNSLLSQLTLKTGLGSSDTFAVASGTGAAISFSNTANTLASSGGSLVFNGGTTLTLANLNADGGNLNLTAGLNGAGNINAQALLTSGNGNITLQATNPSGGTITQTGQFQGQAINATATGNVSVDSVRGTSVTLTSNNGSISSTANPIQSSAQLTLTAKSGITVNALAASLQATNSTSGNISVTQAATPIQALTTTGSGVINNAPGGTVSIDNLGSTITVAAGAPVTSNNGAIKLLATGLTLLNTVDSGTAPTTLGNSVAGMAINVGTANVPNSVSLTQAELDEVTASVLRIGTPTAGAITISNAITTANAPGNINGMLSLINNSTITETTSPNTGSLTATDLRVSSTGPVTLSNVNDVANLAASTTGAFLINNGTNTLTIPNAGVDMVSGVAASGANITLEADNIVIQQVVSPGPAADTTDTVLLEPFTTTLNITVGTASVALSTFGITNGGLGWITSGITQIGTGSDTGTIAITAAINRTPTSTAPTRSQTLSLITGNTSFNPLVSSTTGAITQTAALSVANLETTAVGGVQLTNSSNDIDTIAGSVTGATFIDQNFRLVDAPSVAGTTLTVGTVDGVAGITVAGTEFLELTTSGPLTFTNGLTGNLIGLDATGAVTQGSGAGSALDSTTVGSFPALELLGTGPYTLTNTHNSNSQIAASVTDAVSYTNAGGTTVTDFDYADNFGGNIDGVSTTNAAISINTVDGELQVQSGSPVNAGASTVSLTAGSNNDNQLLDVVAAVTGTDGVTLTGDNITIAAAVSAGTATAVLQPFTSGQPISLGTANSSNTSPLGLSSSEINDVTAGIIVVGNATAGTITVTAQIDPANSNQLELITGADIESTATAPGLTVSKLGLEAVSGIGVNAAVTTSVSNLAATTNFGGINISNSGSALFIGGVTGLNFGVTDTGTTGAITLSNNNFILITTNGEIVFGPAAISITTTNDDIVTGGAPVVYVTNAVGNTIGEYNASTGAAINANFITGLSIPVGVALDGSGNLFVSNFSSGKVAEYNTSTGALINANFITGLSGPQGVLVDGAGHLYVTNFSSGTIGEYNASTGATINASLITGLDHPSSLALDGAGNLDVTEQGDGIVGQFNASTGAPINASLITGLDDPTGLALGSGNLYVANQLNGKIGEYNASTGAPINANFITGLPVSGVKGPFGLALDGPELYVVNNGAGTIGVYNASTGAAINSSFISGLNGPSMLAVAAAPSSGTGFDATNGAVTSTGGTITLDAAGNVDIGDSGQGNSGAGDVLGGSIVLEAGTGSIVVDEGSLVSAHGAGTVTATAAVNVSVQSDFGHGAAIATQGGAITISSGPGDGVFLDSQSAFASHPTLFTTRNGGNGNITIFADNFFLNAVAPIDSINAGTGIVTIQQVTGSQTIQLGATGAGLQISSAEADAGSITLNAAFNDSDSDSTGFTPLGGTLISGDGIFVTATGNIVLVTPIYAPGQTVTLVTSSGAILNDITPPGTLDITANALGLKATTGIGIQNASSPTIGAAQAPLQTQVNHLEAETTTGGINVNNGVTSSTTLSIDNTAGLGLGGVQVLTSGDITLTNAGSINITTSGQTVTGPGNITITANGPSANIQTGGNQAAVTSTGASFGPTITLTAGLDIILGELSSSGSINAGTPSFFASLSLNAGRDIIVQGGSVLDAYQGGSVYANAGRNISIGLDGSASEIVAATGEVGLTTGAGDTFSMGADASVNGFDNVINADKFVLEASGGTSISGFVDTVEQVTGSLPINLSAAPGTDGDLDISNAEINLIAATRTVQIGSTSNSGSITVTAPIHDTTSFTALALQTGGTITESANADSLTVNELVLLAGGAVSANAANAVNDLAADVTGSTASFQFNDTISLDITTVEFVNSGVSTNDGAITITDAATLTVDSVIGSDGGNILLQAATFDNNADGSVNSTGTSDGTITINADNMTLSGTIDSGTARTTLDEMTPGTLINLGGANSQSPLTLGLTNTELDTVTAGVLEIGDVGSSGAMTISAAIDPTGTNNLFLQSASTITEGSEGTVTVANLALEADGDITLANSGNDVSGSGGLAADVLTPGDTFTFNDTDAMQLIVGGVDGVDGISTDNGAINVTATFTGSAGTSTPGLTLKYNVDSSGATVNLTALGTDSFITNEDAIYGSVVDLEANRMSLSTGLGISASSRAILQASTPSRPINLGVTIKPTGALDLSEGDLNSVSAPVLQIGDGTEGNVTIGAGNSISLNSSNVPTLTIFTAGAVLGSGSIAVENLRISDANGADLTGNNNVANLGAAVSTAAQPFLFNDNGLVGLLITTIDGVGGITTNNGAITVSNTYGLFVSNNVAAGDAPVVLTVDLAGENFVISGAIITGDSVTITADSMTLGALPTESIVVGTGPSNFVQLEPFTSGLAVSLDMTVQSGDLSLTQLELNTITAGVVRIGSGSAGDLTINTQIVANGTSALSLISGGSIGQGDSTDIVTATSLALQGNGGVDLEGNNVIVNLAGSASGDTSPAIQATFTVVDDHDLTIATVDSVDGITSDSTINLTVENPELSANDPGLLAVSSPITATGGTINLEADNMAFTAGISTFGAAVDLVTSNPFDNVVTSINLGTADGGNNDTLQLANSDLDEVTTGLLRINSTDGTTPIVISGNLGRVLPTPGKNKARLE